METLKRWVFRASLVLVSLLVVLLAGELALRVINARNKAHYGDLVTQLNRSRQMKLGDESRDVTMSGLVQLSAFEDVVYELKPNCAGRFLGQPVTINAYGVRGREISVQKPAGTFRIIGLGDSVMFGWGVRQEESYLDVLEKRLNAAPGPHPVFEAINFAVPGYNTTLEVATFERKALPLSPDLIVMQFVNNDFGVPAFMKQSKNSLSLKESFLWTFIKMRLGWLVADHNEGLVSVHLQGLEEDERAEVLDLYKDMVGPIGYSNAMDRLAALAKPNNTPVIILMGTCSASQEELVRSLATKHGFRLVDVQPYTDAFVERHHIENTKQARRKVLWISATDHHPTAAGHTIYAEALMDSFYETGLIATNKPESAPRL